MCGLIGMVSTSSSGFYAAHKKIFTNLLWADTLRGDDSTGVFGVNKYGSVDYLKNAGDTSKLFTTTEWKEFEDDIYSSFHMVVGHNRKSTKGATNDENAHPFVEGNTLLVHNGTLYNHAALTDKKVDVDSHAILHSIVERGYEQTIKELDGAFTLIWYDTTDKTLRICRNEERPLYIANTPGAWIFASEEGMLKWIIEREDIKIEDMTDCKPGTMYYFDLDKKETMWHRPLKLKPKNKTTSVVITYPQKKVEEQGASDEYTKKDSPKSDEGVNKENLYVNTDFPIGARIEFLVSQAKEYPSSFPTKFFILGNWILDPTVRIRCNLTDEEMVALECKTNDDVDEDMTLTGVIQTVITNQKKGTVTLVLHEPDIPQEHYDMQGNVVTEDEFIFTDGSCSYCGHHMVFGDVKGGKFIFTKQDDYELMCPACFEKGTY